MSGWLPSVFCVRGWFPSRVGTAVGIASAGIGIGISGLVPLAQYLIDWVGWRWAFRILAVLIVGWVLPATFWLVRDPVSLEAPVTADTARGVSQPPTHWTLALALRDGRYWALAAVFFTGNVVTQMLLVHQVAFLVDHGVSALAAAAVGGVVGAASIVGKIVWGSLSDRTGRELAYTSSFTCTAASVGALVLAGWYPTTLLPYLYAVLIGLGYAGTAPLTPAAASDLFGGPGFSTIFGSLHTLLCLGAAIGSWGAGKIFDWTGSYTGALWMALASAIIAPAMMWVAAPRHPHPRRANKGGNRAIGPWAIRQLAIQHPWPRAERPNRLGGGEADQVARTEPSMCMAGEERTREPVGLGRRRGGLRHHDPAVWALVQLFRFSGGPAQGVRLEPVGDRRRRSRCSRWCMRWSVPSSARSPSGSDRAA